MVKAEIVYGNSATVFNGSEAVEIFRAAAICSALQLYADTGIKANRAYTPRNMMAAAAQITGKKFKPRAYYDAVLELRRWIISEKERIPSREA